ncbi:hypothetical protein CTA2_5984 [Colletotrichum tanaceti]|uniref:DUF7726 domain-containing protein n=1 Tax=Colletotrichum tanaceti TaxID=1306861 RepID=A0A4U6XQ57_9PEZI|nr:hypothetical protein CTA2_5984 [Colletotrichum tanaceti]TKW57955.1 hypothetical protein CTA1_3022 [Colletotrichum tanaceti]
MPPKKRSTVGAVASAAAATVPLGEADANRGSAPNNTTTQPAEKPAPKSRKRKSDAVDDAAAEAPAPAPAPKKQATKGKGDPLSDLSGVYLDGDEDMTVPIFDTCDTARAKIRALLKKDGVTKAAFLRALVSAAYPPGSTHKIAHSSLSDFLKKKGPTSGSTSSVFYAAFVFFEKLRILTQRPKGKMRLEMEFLWPGGFTPLPPSTSYIVPASATVAMDQYGRVHSY